MYEIKRVSKLFEGVTGGRVPEKRAYMVKRIDGTSEDRRRRAEAADAILKTRKSAIKTQFNKTAQKVRLEKTVVKKPKMRI